jgi:hypothetical protein
LTQDKVDAAQRDLRGVFFAQREAGEIGEYLARALDISITCLVADIEEKKPKLG